MRRTMGASEEKPRGSSEASRRALDIVTGSHLSLPEQKRADRDGEVVVKDLDSDSMRSKLWSI